MVVESSRSIGPAAGAAASGLDLSSLSAGRQLEARVTALAGQMATLASRHGTLEVDLGKARVAVGDVLRFEVQAVPGGDGKSGIRLELMPSEPQTATPAATAPAVDPVRAALGRAVAQAVTAQSGLGPLYGALTGLSNAPAGNVPDPVKTIVDQILGGRLAASEPVSASSVAAAFRNSGLFAEADRAARGGVAPPAADQDLKAAFTTLRDALAKWVGSGAPTGSSTASTASGASTTASPTPGNASAGGGATAQAGAGAPRPTTGEPPASASGLAVRAAYGGAAQAAATAQTQTSGQSQPAATPGQPQARPAATPDAQPDGRGRLAAAAYGVPSSAARAGMPPVATAATPVSTPSAGQTVAPVPTPQGAAPAASTTAAPAAAAPVATNPTLPPGTTPPTATVAVPTPVTPQMPTATATPGAAAPTVASPAAVDAAEPPPTAPATPQASASPAAPTAPPAPAVPSAEPAVPTAPAAATMAAPAAAPTTAQTPAASVAPQAATVPAGTAQAPTTGQAAAHGPVAIAGPSGGVMLIRESAQPAAEVPAKPSAAATAGVVVVPPPAEGDEQALAAAFRLVRAVAADLGLAEGAADEAAALGAGIAAPSRERAGKVPPPRKGAPPIAQDPSVGERADTADAAEQLGRRTLERADGALQRILLEQWAVLDTSGEAAAAVQRGGKEWTAELPLATRDGTSIVQMTVERDGKQSSRAGEPSKVGWRVRFALDVEPIGPIHAQIGLSGEHLSVGLWIERPEMAEKLAADIGSLTSALSDGGSVLEAVHVSAGEPPATRAEVQSTSGHFIDVSL